MRDYLNIGSSPYGEPCVQVRSENYRQRARIELQIFKDMLQRHFPEADLGIKWFPHDFGEYGEVVAYYDSDVQESIELALNIEAECPENWDEQAKKSLQAAFGEAS